MGCSVILAIAVLITLSRGALITALVGLAAVGLTQSRKIAISVVLLSLAGVFIVYPAFVDWRLTNLLGSASAAAFQATAESDAGRLTGALAGFSLFLTSPLFGVGFGRYLAAAVQIPGVSNSAHNWYTYMLGEQGIVGALLYISVLASLIPGLRALPSRPRDRRYLDARSIRRSVPVPGGSHVVPDIRYPSYRRRGSACGQVARWPGGATSGAGAGQA